MVDSLRFLILCMSPPPSPQITTHQSKKRWIRPTGALSNADGLELFARITAGETVQGEIRISSFSESRVTYNVIAQTKAGDPNNVIFIGAHSDSVPLGPVCPPPSLSCIYIHQGVLVNADIGRFLGFE